MYFYIKNKKNKKIKFILDNLDLLNNKSGIITGHIYIKSREKN